MGGSNFPPSGGGGKGGYVPTFIQKKKSTQLGCCSRVDPVVEYMHTVYNFLVADL